VDRLASLSLNRPVRVRLDPNMRVASGIQQEFIKIKEAREFDRDAMLLGTCALALSSIARSMQCSHQHFSHFSLYLFRFFSSSALCTRSFKKRVLIFFRAKKEAHRLKVIFGLAGLKAAELHGNLSQNQVRCQPLLTTHARTHTHAHTHAAHTTARTPARSVVNAVIGGAVQRLEALEKFRDGNFDYLLATDLAARGLDILGIETVRPNKLRVCVCACVRVCVCACVRVCVCAHCD
jgi:ATP-dependent RNA helicase DDX27